MKTKKLITILMFGLLALSAFSQSQLNSLFSTYCSNMKVCNTPYANSCIYEMSFIKATQSGQYLNIEYDFAGITRNTIRINLSTATIQTGRWDKSYSREWTQYGDKKVITINDPNGMDFSQVGLRNYNQGRKTNLVEYICFSCTTEPVANRILNELLTLQDKYKQKDPWRIKPEETPSAAQGVSDINACFNKINSMLRDYKYFSPDASSNRNSMATTNIKVSFQYPYLIFTFSDKYINGTISISSVTIGSKTIKTDIRNTSFEYKDYYYNYVYINNEKGFELTKGGAKELVKSTYFAGTELNVKNLTDYLNRFKSLVIQSGFTGNLGTNNSSNSRTNSNSSVGNNKKKRSGSGNSKSNNSGNKTRKSKSGRYGE